MFDFSNINTKLPAQGLKHKRFRKSPRLQENNKQQGQVDNLPIDSQQDPTETLDFNPSTNIVYTV